MATITGVEYIADAQAVLYLERAYGCREPADGMLVVTNPPPEPQLNAAIGCTLWGGDVSLLIGNTLWAERLDEMRIKLVPKPTKKNHEG